MIFDIKKIYFLKYYNDIRLGIVYIWILEIIMIMNYIYNIFLILNDLK